MSGEAHVRIDEGIKRGPRRPKTASQKALADLERTAVARKTNTVIPQDLMPSTVLDRYLSDENTAVIADSYGVSRSRLHQWLLEHAEEHWAKAQIARAITAWEESKDRLESATDALELARAREQLRSAQWALERLFSRLFGQKQEVVHSGTVTFSHALQEISQRRLGPSAAPQPPMIDVDPTTGDPAE
jgi:hypothetical protein